MKGQVVISMKDYNELVEAQKVLAEYSKSENIALVEVYELHKQVEFKAIKESEAVELLVSENKRLRNDVEDLIKKYYYADKDLTKYKKLMFFTNPAILLIWLITKLYKWFKEIIKYLPQPTLIVIICINL